MSLKKYALKSSLLTQPKMKQHSKRFWLADSFHSKNPRLRPIGVGEVPRRIARKVVMTVVKEGIKKVAGCLQL